jgi:hypothetical protein
MKRVRLGATYRFEPTLLDKLHPCCDASPGEQVQVGQLHGAPPPNTMGQCHVNHLDGRLAGMVSVQSLVKP